MPVLTMMQVLSFMEIFSRNTLNTALNMPIHHTTFLTKPNHLVCERVLFIQQRTPANRLDSNKIPILNVQKNDPFIATGTLKK